MTVGSRLLRDARDSEWTRTRDLLLNPDVTAGVLEASVMGVVREGLGADRLEVGIVTWCGPLDERDLCGLGSTEKYARTLRTVIDVVLPTGYAVLNADDPEVAAMSSRCKGGVLFFTRSTTSSAVAEHLERQGRAVVERSGAVILASGARLEELAEWRDVLPHSLHDDAGTLDALLASVAAGWALGASPDTLRSALAKIPKHM